MVAIPPVLLFHAEMSFFGVDIFFIIRFLIDGIVHCDVLRARFSFAVYTKARQADPAGIARDNPDRLDRGDVPASRAVAAEIYREPGNYAGWHFQPEVWYLTHSSKTV